MACGGSDGRCEQGNKIESEPQEGNVEYKLMLVDPTEERLTHLTTQLKWRVAEGQGEAIYAIGVEVRGGAGEAAGGRFITTRRKGKTGRETETKRVSG